VRRPTLIMLIVLFTLLLAAGIAQFMIASGDHPALQGPLSPGQLPSLPPTP
jgi:hypothetical protein